MSEEIRFEDLKILIVDDQAEARVMLKEMLTEIGVTQIFESKDGRQALEFVDTAFDFVDIIVCDWNMPALNGVQLLRQIRSANSGIPFLMVTGRDDMDSVLEAKSSGVTAYIRKPYSSVQLEAKLRIVANRIKK